MLLPRVIVLSRYQKCPPRNVKFNRRNIFIRDHYTCQYCGRTPKEDDLTIDHIIPKSRGGRTVWENVVLACTTCNTAKGSRLPAECNMQPIRIPKRPSWITALHHVHMDEDKRSLWQKFVDTAYWETNLHE
jgi:5-methylcytosine-specific restriction endonuclease McrA